MPELPDVEAYLCALRNHTAGRELLGLRIESPFLVRSVDPPPSAAVGRRVRSFARLGKRIVFGFEGELFFVLHLMIAGRLRWKTRGVGLPGRMGLAAFDFEHGTLLLTEASQKKRASLFAVQGAEALRAHDPGGVEPLECDLPTFEAALCRESHTLKRALTDPRLFSGIGNAYSDEILHRARTSPFRRTRDLAPEDVAMLYAATRATLAEWTGRFVRAAEERFPEKVTAFHADMAVHGRFGEPCPACGAPVQRVVYAENEANYCARCQTGGKLLADRALSRLLKDDWPRTLEELEAGRAGSRAGGQ